MTMTTEMVSFGAGVNSGAMTIWLANQGWRGPIVFADTGCEIPETYCWMSYFEAAWLRPRGLEITRLKGLPWQHYKGGLSLIDVCERDTMIPLAAVRWCTTEYKARPLQRWATANRIERVLLGIAAEEAHRVPDKPRPLVDAGIDRAECVRIIERAGLDVPQKSGCYICPFQRASQWRRLWELHPDLFERAARLEEIAARKTTVARWNITLDPSGEITLRQRQAMYEGQIPMFEPAMMDGLLAYRPCLCGL